MHAAIQQMLDKYQCHSEQDYVNAIKEIFQEIALLGLWRAKFYEKAAFYGGSALRILYGLNRFSEDLDFSLLISNTIFDLTPYNKAITTELHGFGFDVHVETRIKNVDSNIESAFIKAGTKQQLIIIEAPKDVTNRIHSMDKIKIKMEVDINPPGKFTTEVKTLLQPIPFSVKTYIQSDLFAGKVHAILCRPWQTRVKGRDWYDFIWYISRKISLNLTHLKERLIQSKAWSQESAFTKEQLLLLLNEKIKSTDFNNAKKDILPFIRDPQSIELWSVEFFLELLPQLTCN